MTKRTMKRIAFLSFLLYIISVYDTCAQQEKIDKKRSISDLDYIFVFDSSVSFNNSIFKSKASFFGTDFKSLASFDSVNFEKEALFDDANFHTDVKFHGAIFADIADFSNAEFSTNNKNSKADFSNAIFKDLVDFVNAPFNANVDFRYVQFNKSSFEKSTFFKDVDFEVAKFDSSANFNKTKFNKTANFKHAEFNSGVVFKDAEFDGDVDFSSTVFTNQIDFSFVTKISNEIDLTMSIIPGNEPCSINLVGASINKIRFRYKRFKLWFPISDTSNPEYINLDYDLKASVYEALLKKQKNEGFTESYEILDKEYREFMYTHSRSDNTKSGWGQLRNWIDKHWWGYGYSKELIVINSIILYLLFSFINTFFLKHLTTKVYKAEKINEYWEETKGSVAQIFIKSIPFSLFYTAQIFFGFKFDVDKLMYKENLQGWKIFNLVYFITIFLSGLICLAYLMNYVLTV